MRKRGAMASCSSIAFIAIALLGSCGQGDVITAGPEEHVVPYAKDAAQDPVEGLALRDPDSALAVSAPLWTARPASVEASATLSTLRQRFVEVYVQPAPPVAPDDDDAADQGGDVD